MQINFIRRLDELGRLVIPKEIRNQLSFKSGDLLDLNINNDSLIIRKSNSSINMEYVEEIINLVEYLSDFDLILTDSEKIVAKTSNLNEINIEEKLSETLKDLIIEHKSAVYAKGINVSKKIFLEGNVYVKVLIKDSNTVGLLILRANREVNEINYFLNMLVKLLLH